MFGHLRTYRYCIDSILRCLVNPNDADVYIHTWDTIESSTLSWHDDHQTQRKVTKKDVQLIIKKLNPREIIIENQLDVIDKYNLNDTDSALLGQKCMHYSYYSASNMICDDEYDVVLTIRPDIFVFNKLDVRRESIDYFAFSGKKSHSICDYKAVDIINIAKPTDIKKRAIDFHVMFDVHHTDILKKSGGLSYLDFFSRENLNWKVLDFEYGKHWTIQRNSRLRYIKNMVKRFVV